MGAIVGYVVVFVMVFGGYMLAGGKMGIIIEVLPTELMMIGGAGVGTFMISNGMNEIKGVLGDLKYVVKGPHWKPQDYRELLALMFTITRHIKSKGALALESHVDNPRESSLFQQYPRIIADDHALEFITDTIRMIVMSLDDPMAIEDSMQKRMDKHEAESRGRGAALQTLADSLPALGIVAAVLGVVKTMASINAPVEVLGHMIGGALVGTFLGVFLAYAVVGPIAARVHHCHEQDGRYFAVVRDCLVGMLQGHAPPIAVELARGAIPTQMQPKFREVEELLQSLPRDGLAAAAAS